MQSALGAQGVGVQHGGRGTVFICIMSVGDENERGKGARIDSSRVEETVANFVVFGGMQSVLSPSIPLSLSLAVCLFLRV